MELPINKNPPMIAYARHAFVSAILTAPQYADGNDFYVVLEDNNDFGGNCLIHTDNMFADKRNNQIFIGGVPPYNKMSCCLYDKSFFGRDQKEFVIKISYHQYVDSHMITRIFITSNENILDKQDVYVGFVTRFGVYTKDENKKLSYYNDFKQYRFPLWLKMSFVENGSVYLYASYDENRWELLNKVNYGFTAESIIGLAVYAETPQYYNWLYSNHIQLHCSENLTQGNDIPLDFYIRLEKRCSYNYFHPFLNYNRIERTILNDLNIDIVEYIKVNLNQRNYILLLLDEFYVPDRRAYQQQAFPHENLIYGYDDAGFYIMGVGPESKPICTNMTFDVFRQAYKNCKTLYNPLFEICAIKYHTDNAVYKLSVEKIIMDLKDYLESRNSSLYNSHLSVPLNRIFGMSVYDNLTANEINMKKVLSDRRISHLLADHKQLMMDRIKYLFDTNVISMGDMQEILPKVTEAYNTAMKMRNLIMKAQINQRDVSNKVIEYISQMRNIENDYIPKMINMLTH